MKFSSWAFFKKVTVFTLLSTVTMVHAKDLLEFSSVVDLKNFVGTPYFVVMKDIIKPKLDEYATNGFIVADGETLVAQMEDVSSKVSRGATKKISLKTLTNFADAKNKANIPLTFYQLQNDPALRSDSLEFQLF